ncbi:hypothetical protein NYO91_06210 [Arhodomonas aquaeolei]|uniref:hypothetical protein n=1 Tax=Arhodomonas aquaeolei TaxID=2369 RepID=UPI002169FE90|nr:hypothetical protein [Arhodomonas aquaeolei]MCS4503672.1 hypothetical protein [Arhodomonas aquaeolei]
MKIVALRNLACASFIVGVVLSVSASAEVGVVVAEDTPGCDYFVIETSGGYTLAEWYGGVVSIWEGEKVFGDFHSYGFKDIHIEGRGKMRVWLEDYWMSEDDAGEYFYGNCN